MSSWGKFSRGGSYRGGGSYYRGRSEGRGSRGGYIPRGRGGYKPSFYESSRPSSSTSSSTRYSSQQSIEDVGYRRSSYRPETSSYSGSREYSHHASEEVPRKRMRTESYSPSQGVSRRSHESYDSYRGSSGTTRYSEHSRSSHFSGGEVHKVFKKSRPLEHRPQPPSPPTKEDFRRKTMLPPPPPTIRTSFRGGRSLRARRGVIRREPLFRRERPSFTSTVRRSTTELIALRRQNLLRLKRLRESAVVKKLSSSDKKKEGTSGKTSVDDEDDVDQPEEKKLKKEKFKDDDESNEDGKTSRSEVKEEKDEERTDYFGNPFLKLECPQCKMKCITFKEYISHLYKPTHVKAMKDKNTHLKGTLAKLRLAQRAKQKKAEEDDLTSLTAQTVFCPICKLNYSQEKSVHQATETHKKIKSFLLPYCRVCRIAFKSPMMYENHICSLDHLKKKLRLDMRMEKTKTKGSTPTYLDNFMVLDSVGSGDEGDELKEDEEVRDEKTEVEAGEITADTKKKTTATVTKTSESVRVEKEKVDGAEEDAENEEDMNLGSEFIHTVKAMYCEVCRIFLPRLSDPDRVLRIHCRSKTHLKLYLRYGNDDLLKKMSEFELEEQEQTGEGRSKEGEVNDSVDDEGNIDEKLWADVGDLLNQVEPMAKSDDEEEEEGGRYDRFKSLEKKKENGEVVVAGAPAGPAAVAAAPASKVDSETKVNGEDIKKEVAVVA